jgi:ectoine hydroxylase
MSYPIPRNRSREDFYPSRGRLGGRFLERLDPVIYPSSFPCPLSTELSHRYQEDGFLILEDVFDAREVVRLQEEADSLRTRNSDEVIREATGGDVRSVFRVHEQSPVFSQLAADSRLMDLAQFILGDQVYMHQSRVNYKPGFRGQEFFWHSDFETWHVEDGMPAMRAVSMSITLTRNYATNGPLLLIPGSHKKYAVCEGETPAEHYRSSLKKQAIGVPVDEQVRQLADEGGIVAATGKPGSVILFDCNVLHGSGSNITPFPRSNVFFVYNALSNRVEEPFCDLPPRPEYLCSRDRITPLTTKTSEQADESC